VQNEADLSPTNQRDKKRIEEMAEARATEEGESQDEGGERQEGQEEDAENNNDDNDEENDEEPVEIDGAMDTTKPVSVRTLVVSSDVGALRVLVVCDSWVKQCIDDSYPIWWPGGPFFCPEPHRLKF
jgi:hypothetical protein